MIFGFIGALVVLLAIFITLIYFIITNREYSKKILITLRILSVILIIVLAIIAFCIEPTVTNDSYRHFEDIEQMRKEGFKGMTKYDDLIGTKLMFYIVSLTPSNHILPVISVIITYGILLYIINDFTREKRVGSRVWAMAILLNFAMCTFSTVISGVRNAMAFGLIALGIYWEIIKEEKSIKVIIPYIIATTIHAASWMVIAFRLLLFVFKKFDFLKYLLLFWSLIAKYAVDLFYFINIGITILIASKLEAYYMGNWIDDMRLLIVSIILLITIYVITYIVKKEECKPYIEFLQTYILFILGSVFVAKIFVKRLLILLSFLMIPLVYLIEKNTTGRKKLIIYGILVFFICGLIPYSIVEVRGNMGLIFNV